MKPGLVAWIKFNTVGAFGFCVQLIVLTILKAGFGIHYLVATCLSVEAAVLHNFMWHERWTWAHRNLEMSRVLPRLFRLLRFHAANGLISIVGNFSLAWLLVSRFHIHYILANIAAIGVCAVFNYLVSDRLVFRPS